MNDDPTGAVLHALADPARRAILAHLALGEHRVRDLTEHVHLAQSTVSAHLKVLRETGLVTMRPQGRSTFVARVDGSGIDELCAAAEHLAHSLTRRDPGQQDTGPSPIAPGKDAA